MVSSIWYPHILWFLDGGHAFLRDSSCKDFGCLRSSFHSLPHKLASAYALIYSWKLHVVQLFQLLTAYLIRIYLRVGLCSKLALCCHCCPLLGAHVGVAGAAKSKCIFSDHMPISKAYKPLRVKSGSRFWIRMCNFCRVQGSVASSGCCIVSCLSFLRQYILIWWIVSNILICLLVLAVALENSWVLNSFMEDLSSIHCNVVFFWFIIWISHRIFETARTSSAWDKVALGSLWIHPASMRATRMTFRSLDISRSGWTSDKIKETHSIGIFILGYLAYIFLVSCCCWFSAV